MEAIIKHLLVSDLPTLVTFGGNENMLTALKSKLGSRLAGSNVRLELFVDQTAELQTTDLYFCHAGASSIYESIWYGIPMILIPQDFDQFLNSEALQREKVGKVLQIQDTVEGNMREVEKCLTWTLDHYQEMQANAKLYRESFRNGATAKDVVISIENLMADSKTREALVPRPTESQVALRKKRIEAANWSHYKWMAFFWFLMSVFIDWVLHWLFGFSLRNVFGL